MTDLNYNLIPFEKAFVFQVTGQSERLSNYVYNNGPIYLSNGWKVDVSVEPEIRIADKTIFLRGSDSNANLRVDKTYNLPSNYTRDQILSDVNYALKELVKGMKVGEKSTKGNPLAGLNKLGERTSYTTRVTYIELF